MNGTSSPKTNPNIDKLFVVGINFKNADLTTRGKFFLGDDEIEKILQKAKEKLYDDFVVLSTCNRTEIYGSGNHDMAVDLLLEVVGGNKTVFENHSIVKKDKHALKHMFHVATGLDSQILGDYEILGQFKRACKTSKSSELLSPFFERLANSTIQASKKVKTNTAISEGTVSVSYAAIELIKEKYNNQKISVLVLGTGKFGRNVSKNIQKYLPNAIITVANRTEYKAKVFANEFNFNSLPLEEAIVKVRNYDVIIPAISNNETILLDHKYFDVTNRHLIIDLSVPSATDIILKGFDHIELVDLDMVSTMIDRTLEKRKTYLPQAHEIISKEINDFYKWVEVYDCREEILEVKNKLYELSKLCPHLTNLSTMELEKKINKTVGVLVEELQKTGKKLDYTDLEKYFLASTSPGGKNS